jgi:hypothetical protein
MAQVKDALDEDMAEPFVLRSRVEILRFFSGTELLEAGVIHINDWHLEIAPSPPPPAGDVAAPIYGGVGRKPQLRAHVPDRRVVHALSMNT